MKVYWVYGEYIDTYPPLLFKTKDGAEEYLENYIREYSLDVGYTLSPIEEEDLISFTSVEVN